MPSASADHFSLRERAPLRPLISPETELLPEQLKEDLPVSTSEPENTVAGHAVPEKIKPEKSYFPKITFDSEALARPDSIPTQRKTEPMGVAAALTGLTGALGLLLKVHLYHIKAIVLLIMLAVGASLGIASLVRIGDDPRKYKGRFGGWLSIFLASLPILYFIMIALSYK